MEKNRKTSVAISVDKEMLDRWKTESLKLGYANFSQFVRETIEEKLAGVRDVRDTPSPQTNDFDW